MCKFEKIVSSDMATISIKIHKRTNAKGLNSVYSEISHKGKRKKKSLFSIPIKYWNPTKLEVRKSYVLHEELNAKIQSELSRFNEIVLNVSDPDLELLANGNIENSIASPKLSDAIQQYSELVGYKAKRKYLDLRKKIIGYRDIELRFVDPMYIKGFESYMKQLPSISSQTTIHRQVNSLKTILRQHRYSFPELQRAIDVKINRGRSISVSLSREEFNKIESCPIEILNRDVFITQVYMRGKRISDILQFHESHIYGDRAIFKEQKTQKSSDIKLIPKVLDIIEKYKGMSEFGYVFPILKMPPDDLRKNQVYGKHIESKTTMINRGLKLIAAYCKIEKKVTTHVARHTFAVWLDEKGVDSRSIKDILNHSSLETTEKYLKKLRRSSELDDAADTVWE